MTVAAPNRVHEAVVLSVHDGDTVKCVIDCDFHLSFTTDVRLNGIDAPELHLEGGGDNPLGIAAREHLIALIGGRGVVLRTFRNANEKYGRWRGDLLDADGRDLCKQMIADGHAKPYDGTGPKPW